MIHFSLRPAFAALLLAAAFPAFAAFTDNGDGTVTDTVTGLMWDKCTWGQSNISTCAGGVASGHTWAEALAVAVTANSASHRGHSDWRLPNVNELESLVKIDAYLPAIDTVAFPNTASSWYWTSTTYAPVAAGAWYVNFDYGYPDADDKPLPNHVRLVRSGQSFASFDSLGDSTAPSLSSVGVSGTTSSGTTLAATSNEAATGYWVVLAGNGASAPSAAQLKAGQSSTGAAGAASGNGAMLAATAKSFSVTGLAASTAYTVCVLAEDASANQSTVSCSDLTTSAAPVTGACGTAHGVASLAAPASHLCAAGSAGAVSSGAATHTWDCAGSGGGSTASCSAPRAWTVTPTASAGGSSSPATAQTLTHNATQAFALTPASGYELTSASGCSGSLAGSTYTTAAITGDCAVSFTFTPIVVVSPPDPPPTPTVDSGGGTLSTTAGGTVRITDNQQGGSTLTLTGAGSTRIEIGGTALTVETTSTTQLTVVRGSDGSLGLKVENGQLTVFAEQTRQTVAVAGGQKVESNASDSRVVCEYQNGMLRRIVVQAGEVVLPQNSFASSDTRLLAGEVAEFDAAERVTARYLGSATGSGLGDSLPGSATLGYTAGVPRLAGVPVRQKATGETRDLDLQYAALLSNIQMTAARQDAQGVIRMTDAAGNAYAALPLGRVSSVAGVADGVTINADGSARLTSGGFAVNFAPSVADPQGLAAAIAGRLSNTTASVIDGGIWLVRESGKPATAFRPGWRLNAPASSAAGASAGFGSTASGQLTFTDSSFKQSMLYPAPAEHSSLLAAARTIDTAATLSVGEDGMVTLVVSNTRYTLQPEFSLAFVPPEKAGLAFWIENGKLFTRVRQWWAQGFLLQ